MDSRLHSAFVVVVTGGL